MQNIPWAEITAIAIFVFGILFSIIGFLVSGELGSMKTAIIDLANKLAKTSVDFAALTVKTEVILESHEKRLDQHENILGKIKGAL